MRAFVFCLTAALCLIALCLASSLRLACIVFSATILKPIAPDLSGLHQQYAGVVGALLALAITWVLISKEITTAVVFDLVSTDSLRKNFRVVWVGWNSAVLGVCTAINRGRGCAGGIA